MHVADHGEQQYYFVVRKLYSIVPSTRTLTSTSQQRSSWRRSMCSASCNHNATIPQEGFVWWIRHQISRSHLATAGRCHSNIHISGIQVSAERHISIPLNKDISSSRNNNTSISSCSTDKNSTWRPFICSLYAMLKIRQGNGCEMVLLSKLFEYFAAKIYAILAVLYLTWLYTMLWPL